MFGGIKRELSGIRKAILNLIPVEDVVLNSPDSQPKTLEGRRRGNLHASLHNFRRDVLVGKKVGEKELEEKIGEILKICGYE